MFPWQQRAYGSCFLTDMPPQSQLVSESNHMNEFWLWLKDPNSMSTMEELQKMSPNLSLGCTCKHTHTHVNPHGPHIHMETEKAITHWTLHPAVYFPTIPTLLSKLHVCSMRWLYPLGSQNWAFFFYIHCPCLLMLTFSLFFYFILTCSNFYTFFFFLSVVKEWQNNSCVHV